MKSVKFALLGSIVFAIAAVNVQSANAQYVVRSGAACRQAVVPSYHTGYSAYSRYPAGYGRAAYSSLYVAPSYHSSLIAPTPQLRVGYGLGYGLGYGYSPYGSYRPVYPQVNKVPRVQLYMGF